MTIQLLVLSEYDANDSDGMEFRRAADLAVETKTFLVRYCSSPASLIDTVKKVVLETFQKIDVLDLFGHGAAGELHMGKEILFDHTGVGVDIAAALVPLLTT